MNFNYIWDVTLANSFSYSILKFSFGLADCGKMWGGSSGRYNSLRPILTVALLSFAVLQKVGDEAMLLAVLQRSRRQSDALKTIT